MIDALEAEWRERVVDHRGPLFFSLQMLAMVGMLIASSGAGLLDDPSVPALIVVGLAALGANSIAALMVRIVHRVRRRSGR